MDILRIHWSTDENLAEEVQTNSADMVWCGESLFIKEVSPSRDSELSEDENSFREKPSLPVFYSKIKHQLLTEKFDISEVTVQIGEKLPTGYVTYALTKDILLESDQIKFSTALNLVNQMVTTTSVDDSNTPDTHLHALYQLHSYFNPQGKILKCELELLWFLPESVLRHQSSTRSSFNIFKSFITFFAPELKTKYYISDAELVKLLKFKNSKQLLSPGNEDTSELLNPFEVLTRLNVFTDLDLHLFCAIISCIFNLSCVEIQVGSKKGTLDIKNGDNFTNACKLLLIDSKLLFDELSTKFKMVRGAKKPTGLNTAEECNQALFAFILELYKLLLEFITFKLNKYLNFSSLKDDEKDSTKKITCLFFPRPQNFNLTSKNVGDVSGSQEFAFNCIADLLALARTDYYANKLLTAIESDNLMFSSARLEQLSEWQMQGQQYRLIMKSNQSNNEGAIKEPGLLELLHQSSSAKELYTTFTKSKFFQSIKDIRMLKLKATKTNLKQFHLSIAHYCKITSLYDVNSLFLSMGFYKPSIKLYVQSIPFLENAVNPQHTCCYNILNLFQSEESLNLFPWQPSSKYFFVDTLDKTGFPLLSYQVPLIRLASFYHHSYSHKDFLTTYADIVLPFTKSLEFCSPDEENCNMLCGEACTYAERNAHKFASHLLPSQAKSLRVLIGNKRLYFYDELLNVFNAINLDKHAIALQTLVRSFLAKVCLQRRREQFLEYNNTLAVNIDSMRTELRYFFDTIRQMLTDDVNSSDVKLLKSFLPQMDTPIEDKIWGKLIVMHGKLKLHSHDIINPHLDVRYFNDDDTEFSSTNCLVLRNVCALPSNMIGGFSIDYESGDIMLTRCEDSSPVWGWGFWSPEDRCLSEDAIRCGSDYPNNTPIKIFSFDEWVSSLGLAFEQHVCSVNDVLLRCLTPIIIKNRAVGSLATQRPWLLLINYQELRSLQGDNGNLHYQVTKTVKNVKKFQTLHPRRHWVRVHLDEKGRLSQHASVFTKLQDLDSSVTRNEESFDKSVVASGRRTFAKEMMFASDYVN